MRKSVQRSSRQSDHIKTTLVVWTCLLFIRSGQSILQGTVKGGRRHGRQNKKWEDNIREWTGLEFTKSLVTSLVLSRLEYCNSLLSGIPQQLIDKLQKVQNCSARLIFKMSKYTHVSPLLAKLHWFPIAQRIDHKISSLCYDVVSDTAPL